MINKSRNYIPPNKKMLKNLRICDFCSTFAAVFEIRLSQQNHMIALHGSCELCGHKHLYVYQI